MSKLHRKSFLQDGRFCMSSSVKTDWDCSLKALAIAQSDVAGKPELVLRAGMPVTSLCRAQIYYQDDIGLSLRLAATISDMKAC